MHSKLDQIFIRELSAFGIIGTHDHERIKAQKIVINATLWVDNIRATISDSLDDTVDYQRLTDTFLDHVAKTQPQLVERLACELLSRCFDLDSRIQAVQISIEKPLAIAAAKAAGFVMFRTREECES